MPNVVCLEPRCPNPAVWRGRCATHKRTREHEIPRAGYHVYRTARWRRTRRRYLFEHPLCELLHCDAIAEHVHHRQDLDEGGDPWAFANLQALCAACHGRITNERLR